MCVYVCVCLFMGGCMCVRICVLVSPSVYVCMCNVMVVAFGVSDIGLIIDDCDCTVELESVSPNSPKESFLANRTQPESE